MENNFDIVVTEQAAVISANFDDVKEAVQAKVNEYKGLVFTDEQIPEARKVVADLRKAVKAFETKRKEVKKSHMIPYEEFEKQAKELVGIINGAIDPIDSQIKQYEENKREEKKIAIRNYFNSVSENVKYAVFEEVWQDKWITNISTSMASIKREIDSYIKEMIDKDEKEKADIETIKAMESDIEDKAIELYMRTKELSKAIQLIQDDNKRKQEIIDQECKRKEEEERLRIEREEKERIRKEQEEKQRIIEEAKKQERERILAEQNKEQASFMNKPEYEEENLKLQPLGKLNCIEETQEKQSLEPIRFNDDSDVMQLDIHELVKNSYKEEDEYLKVYFSTREQSDFYNYGYKKGYAKAMHDVANALGFELEVD